MFKDLFDGVAVKNIVKVGYHEHRAVKSIFFFNIVVYLFRHSERSTEYCNVFSLESE